MKKINQRGDGVKKRLIGMRNFKTALCVLLCMSLTAFLNFIHEFIENESVKEIYSLLFVRDTALYSCIAAVISLQATVSQTKRTGIIRVMGTLFGGAASVVIIYINSFFDSVAFSFLIVFLGVIGIISLCNLISQAEYASVAVVMFLIVVFSSVESSAYVEAIHRFIDTVGGAVIAFAVNRFVFPPKEIKNRA